MSILLDRADDRTGPALCALCERPLATSPSDDFCSESCQQKWHAANKVDQSITRGKRPAA
ncbi:hypothetical protein [Saccharopolyspora erythraea]|uniref:Uncharacterized protein n=2 Tax=Saccharopolyspora erythraea TaxID=1836 RepID=A4FHQ3_SACEN|nr:hypothetical protein [Saccharopolyspora erythraea]EQD86825.1 hypothetical protein N599_07750 [Saccharopolyspora erythraea D]QRK87460.1 hypothetical protein JQX30_21950 [Saccharopolyspora erythraea]CAM03578.1 hypothetical protein SACE_4309 [Saccharopolyspora erythraea NRRL 2338]